MDLVPFLLLIVAGWLAGHVVVGALALIERSGVRLLGHLAVALVFVALAVLVFPRWGAILDPLPPIARDASYMLGMAAIPMMGWVWLALIGLITTHVASPAKEAHGPSWEANLVRFAAVSAPMRALTKATLVAAGVAGVATLVAVMLWQPLIHGGPRVLVFLVALVGMPIYAVLKRRLVRDTVPCSVRIAPHELIITSAKISERYGYREIDRLIWQTTGEYARLEIGGGGRSTSLLVGIARREPGILPTLPPLSGKFRRVLVTNGLVEDSRHENKGTLKYVRRRS